MEKVQKEERLVIRIDANLKRGLADVAKKSRRNSSDYLRLLIEDAIQKQIRL